MTHIHDKEVNKISECNLLHDIINTPKLTKICKSRYSPIIHGCMNTIKVETRFKNFLILLDREGGYTIVIGRLVEKLNPENIL